MTLGLGRKVLFLFGLNPPCDSQSCQLWDKSVECLLNRRKEICAAGKKSDESKWLSCLSCLLLVQSYWDSFSFNVFESKLRGSRRSNISYMRVHF